MANGKFNWFTTTLAVISLIPGIIAIINPSLASSFYGSCPRPS